LKKLIAEGRLSGSERAVCLITGSGLKDVDTAMKIAGKTIPVEPDLESLKKAISIAGIE